jgi:hypothetical protein
VTRSSEVSWSWRGKASRSLSRIARGSESRGKVKRDTEKATFSCWRKKERFSCDDPA